MNNDETTTQDKAMCEHCGDCKNGSCCSDCKNKKCDCKSSDCKDCASTKKVHTGSMVCEAGMCGQQSTWKWYFVVAIIAVILGLLVGSVIGKANMRKKMLAERPDDIKTMMNDVTARVTGARGDELDRMYVDMMIMNYNANIDMSTAVKSKSRKQVLRDFADTVITTNNKDLGKLEAWQTEWFGTDK